MAPTVALATALMGYLHQLQEAGVTYHGQKTHSKKLFEFVDRLEIDVVDVLHILAAFEIDPHSLHILDRPGGRDEDRAPRPPGGCSRGFTAASSSHRRRHMLSRGARERAASFVSSS